MKKRDYDEQLRREESKTRSVCQKSHGTSCQVINAVLLVIMFFCLIVNIWNSFFLIVICVKLMKKKMNKTTICGGG